MDSSFSIAHMMLLFFRVCGDGPSDIETTAVVNDEQLLSGEKYHNVPNSIFEKKNKNLFWFKSKISLTTFEFLFETDQEFAGPRICCWMKQIFAAL